MTLDTLRAEIDEADRALLDAFRKRMETAEKIGRWKRENGKPVLDPQREREKLADLAGKLPSELADYGYALWSLLFAMSREVQGDRATSPLGQTIRRAMEETPALFPQRAVVACQGVEGAYAQLACEKLFPHPQILYFSTFDGVFSAVESGLCEYGVLPIENSTAGSVQEVYDGMLRHDFHIVRSARLKVEHHLVAKPGTRLEDVREVLSHPQALRQCAAYLGELGGGVTLTPCANTAAAAEQVAKSGRTDVASISSRSCLALYGLAPLAEGIQDRDNNYTRFLCVSKKLEIYPGADRTSLRMVLPHRPGSLSQVLTRFAALGLNLLKLESRPLPQREFEFQFYFDLETPLYDGRFLRMIDGLGRLGEDARYLGSYSEVI